MKLPTKRQQEVLDFIAAYLGSNAYPPTLREIAAYFRISIKGASDHILALKKKGCIKQDDKKSRAIELIGIEAETDFRDIPILGRVAAGVPIQAVENNDGSIRFPRSMLKKNGEYFALKVTGDSMEGAGIMDGDTAIIEIKNNNIRNGEIAVVMLDDSVTIKTFYLENTRVKLQSENPKYSPIFCNQDIRILGRLAHIMRSYDKRS